METEIYFGFDNVITKINTIKYLKKREKEYNLTWRTILGNMSNNKIINDFFKSDYNFIYTLQIHFKKIKEHVSKPKIIIISKNYYWLIKKVLKTIDIYDYVDKIIGRGVLLAHDNNYILAKTIYLSSKNLNKIIYISSNVLGITHNLLSKNKIKNILVNKSINKKTIYKIYKYLTYFDSFDM